MARNNGSFVGRARLGFALGSAGLLLIALVHYGYHGIAFTEQLARIAVGASR